MFICGEWYAVLWRAWINNKWSSYIWDYALFECILKSNKQTHTIIRETRAATKGPFVERGESLENLVYYFINLIGTSPEKQRESKTIGGVVCLQLTQEDRCSPDDAACLSQLIKSSIEWEWERGDAPKRVRAFLKNEVVWITADSLGSALLQPPDEKIKSRSSTLLVNLKKSKKFLAAIFPYRDTASQLEIIM